jgi:beta-alanine--pyruvate transaminase
MTINPRAVESYWMPFTANRDYKENPRVFVGAEGHHYLTDDGRRVYDAFSGLWTSGLGHCHPKIVEAVQKQVATLDYSLGFQAGSDRVFELSEKLTAIAPEGFNRVFFTNSGSESADTSLKIALAYHRAKGEGYRTRLIGREKGYHGVNFGGMSVGGMTPNRKAFGSNLIPQVDHLRHTLNTKENAFSRGQPPWGLHLAEDLERLAQLHDGGNIAAVIVEPVPGSAGIIPPPVGYLERLREICDQYGILLIFDEVINAFGRVGAAFGAERFGVMPDMINLAKGLTNGVIPMGAVLVRDEIYEALMHGPQQIIELFHGYTYSGHPVAAAAGIAALDAYREEGTFEQARELESHFEDAIHSLGDHPLVTDVRNFGLMGGVDLAPRPDGPGMRGLEIHKRLFWDEDLVVRNSMDLLQFSPFLNSRPEDITMTVDKVRKVLDSID